MTENFETTAADNAFEGDQFDISGLDDTFQEFDPSSIQVMYKKQDEGKFLLFVKLDNDTVLRTQINEHDYLLVQAQAKIQKLMAENKEFFEKVDKLKDSETEADVELSQEEQEIMLTMNAIMVEVNELRYGKKFMRDFSDYLRTRDLAFDLAYLEAVTARLPKAKSNKKN